jgi:hypothetical protein
MGEESLESTSLPHGKCTSSRREEYGCREFGRNPCSCHLASPGFEVRRLSSAEPVIAANATIGSLQQAELVRRVADQLSFGGTGILVVDTLVERGGSGATSNRQAQSLGAISSLGVASWIVVLVRRCVGALVLCAFVLRAGR